MKLDMIIAGVGGQGILSISAIIARAALKDGLHMKQAEVHGMAQRGGAVQSHLRLSDRPIHSDLIRQGSASLILAVEPMESLRYLPFLSRDGWLVTNSRPVENIDKYPDIIEVQEAIEQVERHVLFDADALAAEHGTRRCMNVAMLGAATPFIGLPEARLEEAIHDQFAEKGEQVIAVNLAVYRAARQLVRELTGQ